jgi:shikimate dehydrogenase
MYQSYGVVGHPLGHSLSPFLHNQAFQKFSMERCYFKWEITPDDLADFMRAVRDLPLFGVSVTIPHKEKVMSFLDHVSPEAREIGAVNTIYHKGVELWGTNTDYLGFMAPLKGLGFESALVLGAGGAARSVLYGLKKMGAGQVYISNRNRFKADKLAEEFQIQPIDWSVRGDARADILVNTTPLGTSGENQTRSPWEFEKLPFKAVYDLVYNPLKTGLLRQAESRGLTAISGLSMFVHQAREQFRIWTGQAFDPDWAESLLRARLAGEPAIH